MRGEPTVIGPECSLNGAVLSRGDILIFGRVRGNIEAGGTVRVFEHAVVEAEITAAVVRVEGTVEGTVRAAQRVSVGPRGRLVGDVFGTLSIDDGGFVQGRGAARVPPPAPVRRAPVKPVRVYDVDPPRAPSTGAIPSISEADISDALFQIGDPPPPRPKPSTVDTGRRARRMLRAQPRSRGRTDPGASRPPGATITPAVVQAVTTGQIEAAMGARVQATAEQPAIKSVAEVALPAAAPGGTNPGALLDEWFQDDEEQA